MFSTAVGKSKLFKGRLDYEAFHRCLIDALEVEAIRVLGYCVMPNHWHLLLWPRKDKELARFMMRLTNTHVRRWLTAHDQVGTGHLYQGRYKSFASQDDGHFTTVARYVELKRPAGQPGATLRRNFGHGAASGKGCSSPN